MRDKPSGLITHQHLLGVPKVICFVLHADPEEDGTDGFFVAVFQRRQLSA